MKTIKMNFLYRSVLLMGVLFFSTSTFTQNIIGAKGNILAHINSSGVIKDTNDKTIGKFSENGEIQNAIGETIGSVTETTCFDLEGNILGKSAVDNNSISILDEQDREMAKIVLGTDVVLEDESLLFKSATAINKMHLIAYLFFFL